MPTYLVERYWPGVTVEEFRSALERERAVIARMSEEGACIRVVSSMLIPADEVLFSVYEAPTATVVRRLNEQAGIPFDRIVEAEEVAERSPPGE